MKAILPSDLLRAAQAGFLPENPVALDTETSGLFVDSGARVATVSVGWIDHIEQDPWNEESYWAWRAWLEADQLSTATIDYTGEGEVQKLTNGTITTWRMEKIGEGLDDEGVISFAWAYDQGVSGTGKPEDTGQGTLWADADNLPREEWEALLEWIALLDAAGVKGTMHHAKFDLHQMEAGTRRWDGFGADLENWVDWDTQNGADLMTGWRFGTTSLKPTSMRLWSEAEGDEKKVVADYLKKAKLPAGRWDLIPWDIIARYADGDARLTARLRRWQEILGRKIAEAWLDGKDGRMTVDEALDRRLRTSKMLRRTERRGLPWNGEGAMVEARKIRKKEAVIADSLPFRPTLPNAKHYWFGPAGDTNKQGVTGLGIPAYSRTDKGGAQLDQLIISKMVEEGIPAAADWRDLVKLSGARGRWYEGWTERQGRDGRLRTSVRQNGTVSGRFSVENIQLQAIPHDYKLQGFEILNGVKSPRTLIGEGVPKGWALWELDLAQAELRVAAMFAQCTRMLDLIEQGADLHGDACEELFDVHPGDPDWGKMRQVAKRANFSLIFGVGWETLQNDIEEQTGIRFTEVEARRLVRGWNALYPEYQKAIKHTMAVVEERQRKNRGYGWVQTINGERRWFKPGEETHKAFNQRVQANLAQYGLDWWLWAEAEMMGEWGDEPVTNEHGWVGRVGVVLMVHDSTVLLVPETAEGQVQVEKVQAYGKDLWKSRFPGVPGDIDVSAWAAHS